MISHAFTGKKIKPKSTVKCNDSETVIYETKNSKGDITKGFRKNWFQAGANYKNLGGIT